MFVRVEVTLKPEHLDHHTAPLLRKIEVAHPELRKSIRWARKLDVYWMDLPITREELILALNEVLFDPVLSWLFTGNLIPSAAGSRGGLEDLLETAPHRPGQFFAIEKRFRVGANDLRGNSLLRDFEITLKRKLPEARICSGALLILEGTQLDDDKLSVIAREYFANEVQESWTLMPAKEFQNSERFFAERIKREMPKPSFRSDLLGPPPKEEEIADDSFFLKGLKNKKINFSEDDLKKTREFYQEHMHRDLNFLEGELIARVLEGKRSERALDPEIMLSPSVLKGIEYSKKELHFFNDTFLQSSRDNPRSWMLTNFEKNKPAILGVDEDEALFIRVGSASNELQSNSFLGTSKVVASTLGRIIAEEKGVRPLFLQDTIETSVPECGVQQRRVLDGVKTGLSVTARECSVPLLGGALDIHLSKTISSLGVFAVGSLPRSSIDLDREFKKAEEGEKLFLLAHPFEREQAASFDCLYFKRMEEFILEASSLGLISSLSFCGDLTLLEGLLECSERLGGIDVYLDQLLLNSTKKSAPLEILNSIRTERYLIRVAANQVDALLKLSKKRDVCLNSLGHFSSENGVKVFIQPGKECLHLRLDLFPKLLHREKKEALYDFPEKERPIIYGSVRDTGLECLLKLLSHPHLCSREWLTSEFDQEVKGNSILKPLHSTQISSENAFQGPNDGIALRTRPLALHAIVASMGSHSRMMKMDPYLAGLLSVDESVRNALSSGADYGKEDSLFALSYLLNMPRFYENQASFYGELSRLTLGAYYASKELELPFVSGKENFIEGEESTFRLQIQSLAKISKVAGVRSSDFKSVSDSIYLLGHAQFSLVGSLVAEIKKGLPDDAVAPTPDWSSARRLYSWLGGAIGKEQKKCRSIHDVSDGGLLCTITESLLSRNYGATIQFPEGLSETMEWEFLFGEGFHGMVVTVSEADVPLFEAEWQALEIPYCQLGQVIQNGVLQIKRGERSLFAVETKLLRQAWKKEGYWE